MLYYKQFIRGNCVHENFDVKSAVFHEIQPILAITRDFQRRMRLLSVMARSRDRLA